MASTTYTIKKGDTLSKIAKKYGTKNAPPPFSYTKYGNLHMLPSPTADPTAANINPSFVPH